MLETSDAKGACNLEGPPAKSNYDFYLERSMATNSMSDSPNKMHFRTRMASQARNKRFLNQSVNLAKGGMQSSSNAHTTTAHTFSSLLAGSGVAKKAGVIGGRR